MQETEIDRPVKVIEQTCMVFGQMNEPLDLVCESLSALTMAEYFRDQTGKDTLLFVDNIFRFSQAGSEVSAFWVDTISRGLPAHLGDGNGCFAGANHFNEQRCHHVGSGSLCSGR